VALVVGLGNPGPAYAQTRHNAGFLVLDVLARRHGLRFRRGRLADEAPWGAITLLKPRLYMNLSGQVVQAYVTRYGLGVEQLLVVHDDLDLPLGRLRFKRGGGAGGQKGVADIAARLGAGFYRLKIGISRPPEGMTAERWVLSRFRDDEQALLACVLERAVDAIEVFVHDGFTAAANRFNGHVVEVGEVE
jgi:PTH1 family peptidyl-tRNA hydrolase